MENLGQVVPRVSTRVRSVFVFLDAWGGCYVLGMEFFSPYVIAMLVSSEETLTRGSIVPFSIRRL